MALAATVLTACFVVPAWGDAAIEVVATVNRNHVRVGERAKPIAFPIALRS